MLVIVTGLAVPSPEPITKSHNFGVNVDATSLLFSRKTLNSRNHSAYILVTESSMLQLLIVLCKFLHEPSFHLFFVDVTAGYLY